MKERRSEAGFTVVEILVAFALVAFGMVAAIQIARNTSFGLGRVAAVDVVNDEALGIVALRVASGLHPGIERGAFSNGESWSLSVVDVGHRVGWQNVPPLWRVRLTRGGSDGPTIYSTLIAGGFGG